MSLAMRNACSRDTAKVVGGANKVCLVCASIMGGADKFQILKVAVPALLLPVRCFIWTE